MSCSKNVLESRSKRFSRSSTTTTAIDFFLSHRITNPRVAWNVESKSLWFMFLYLAHKSSSAYHFLTPPSIHLASSTLTESDFSLLQLVQLEHFHENLVFISNHDPFKPTVNLLSTLPNFCLYPSGICRQSAFQLLCYRADAWWALRRAWLWRGRSLMTKSGSDACNNKHYKIYDHLMRQNLIKSSVNPETIFNREIHPIRWCSICSSMSTSSGGIEFLKSNFRFATNIVLATLSFIHEINWSHYVLWLFHFRRAHKCTIVCWSCDEINWA